jgi:hypothetical protein
MDYRTVGNSLIAFGATILLMSIASGPRLSSRRGWRTWLFGPTREVPLAVILVPSSGEDMMINWWTWRPTVALLVRAGILPAGEREERYLPNGCGGYLTQDGASQAANFIERLVAGMEPEERVLFDGTVTTRPINYDLPISEWDDQETWNNYSAQYDVLKKVAEVH